MISSSSGEEDEVNPTWFQMGIAIRESDIEKSADHNDLFQACIIQEAYGFDLDPEVTWTPSIKLDLTNQAMIALMVNEIVWIQFIDEQIPTTELEEMYFKLKIYACDEKEASYETGR